MVQSLPNCRKVHSLLLSLNLREICKCGVVVESDCNASDVLDYCSPSLMLFAAEAFCGVWVSAFSQLHTSRIARCDNSTSCCVFGRVAGHRDVL